MGNIVIVQQINTHWTKASRGGESAGRRNTVPDIAGVPLERIAGAPLRLLHHRLSYSEYNGFTQPIAETCVNLTIAPLVVGCVTIHYTEDEATATFRYDRDCGGAPERGWALKTLRMAVNEWGQIAYNGRFQDYDGGQWWYEKTVVNVGICERLTAAVFTNREPTCRFAVMGELF